MTREQHVSEAARYDRLATEALNQVTSAMPASYYQAQADAHRTKASG